MYLDFFGITAKPFELLPNPNFLYLSKGHKKALSYLQYGLQEGAGFTLLTGEVGSCKTTLLRDIVNKNKSNTLAMIFNTKITGVELLAMTNEDFGLDINDKNKVTLLRDLNDFLVAEYSVGRRPILIIDEAQNLSVEALEEVRLLSNLEADNCKLLQIILVGQPELKGMIARPELRQLRQRISVSCHLLPLGRDEMEDYIYHRLETVGNRNAVHFQPDALDEIYRFSGGVPRLVNLLCDALLLAAFVEETREIALSLVRESIDELALENPEESPVPGFVEALEQGSIGARLDQIEENYLRLSAASAERESVLDRLSSQGRILEYMINQQQHQFSKFDDDIKRVSDKLELLRQLLLEKHSQDVVCLDARKKK
ncbi:MAG: ATPase [Desulfuromonas sp.]|nr:MAG: ATPase [Desulfuromonas sp.]